MIKMKFTALGFYAPTLYNKRPNQRRHIPPTSLSYPQNSSKPFPLPASELKSTPIHGKRIQGHIIQQIHTPHINPFRRLRNRLITHILEERRARRQIPHFVSAVPVVAAEHAVVEVCTVVGARRRALRVRRAGEEAVLIVVRGEVEGCC